jgi:hypothetical protein
MWAERGWLTDYGDAGQRPKDEPGGGDGGGLLFIFFPLCSLLSYAWRHRQGRPRSGGSGALEARSGAPK